MADSSSLTVPGPARLRVIDGMLYPGWLPRSANLVPSSATRQFMAGPS